MSGKASPNRLASSITELGHTVLSAIVPSVREGLTLRETIRASQYSEMQVRHALREAIGSAGWPPEPSFLAAALELPVRPNVTPQGHSYRPTSESDRSIAEKREKAAQARAAHEAYWLERERVAYDLPKRGRPLSGMAA